MSFSFNFQSAPKKSNGARQSMLSASKPHQSSASVENDQFHNLQTLPQISPEERVLQLKEDGNTLAEAGAHQFISLTCLIIVTDVQKQDILSEHFQSGIMPLLSILTWLYFMN